MRIRKIVNNLKDEFRGIFFFPKKARDKKLFLAILVIGAYFRISGLTWGIPKDFSHSSPFHDEAHVVKEVLADNFLDRFGDYEVFHGVGFWRILYLPFSYPPFTLIGKLLGYNPSVTVSYTFIVLRLITATFGILSIFFVYLLATKLYNAKVGLYSAALFSVIPFHWWLSQLIKEEVINTSLYILALIISIAIIEKGTLFWFAVSGLISGTGFSVNPGYLLAMVIITISIVVRIFKERVSFNNFLRLNIKRFIYLVSFGLVALILFYPYPFFNFDRFNELFFLDPARTITVRLEKFYDLSFSNLVGIWRAYQNPTRPYLTLAFGDILPNLFLIAIAFYFLGLVVGLIRKKTNFYEWLVFIFGLLIYLSIGSLGSQIQLAPRYFLYLSPIFVLVTAKLLIWNFRKSRFIAQIFMVIGLLIFLYTTYFSWAYFYPFAFADPRKEAVEWIHKNVGNKYLIGEIAPWDRQSLSINKEKVEVIPLSYRNEKNLIRYHFPDYVVIQRPPTHYDQNFKYYGFLNFPEDPDVLKRRLEKNYEMVKIFGKVPRVLGREVPRTLVTPIIDLYEKIGDPVIERKSLLSKPFIVSPNRVKGFSLSNQMVASKALEVVFEFNSVQSESANSRSAVFISLNTKPNQALTDEEKSNFFSDLSKTEILNPNTFPSGVNEFDDRLIFYFPFTRLLVHDKQILSLMVDFRDSGRVDLYTNLGKGRVFFKTADISFPPSTMTVGIYSQDSNSKAKVKSIDLLKLVE